MRKDREIVIFVEGGIVQGVYYFDEEKKSEYWDEVPYTLVDYDIDGIDESKLCTGCRLSADPHYYSTACKSKEEVR